MCDLPTNCPAKCTGYPLNNFFISSSIGPFPMKANRAPGLLSKTKKNTYRIKV